MSRDITYTLYRKPSYLTTSIGADIDLHIERVIYQQSEPHPH